MATSYLGLVSNQPASPEIDQVGPVRFFNEDNSVTVLTGLAVELTSLA
jgi:hypothetical protein